jgi:hypothetical protein
MKLYNTIDLFCIIDRSDGARCTELDLSSISPYNQLFVQLMPGDKIMETIKRIPYEIRRKYAVVFA